jgi:hypothetical protein
MFVLILLFLQLRKSKLRLFYRNWMALTTHTEEVDAADGLVDERSG